MKKIIVLFAMAAFFGQSKAQVVEVKDVPGVVVTTFQGSYPSVSHVEWRRVGTNYEADYMDNQNDSYVVYDPSGKVVEVAQGVTYTTVPEPAMTYVKTKYKGDKMTKVFKVKDSSGKVIYKGKVKDSYLLFDSNGNFIREVK